MEFIEEKSKKLFPELLEELVQLPYILSTSTNLLKEEKGNVALQNLLSGKTKEGIFGDEFFVINQKLVDLQQPLISDEGKQIVEQIQNDIFDAENRGYKNLMKMMVSDGLFKFLPKNDEAWVTFLKPFMKLIRKEKRKI
jgi:hypothetical protein